LGPTVGLPIDGKAAAPRAKKRTAKVVGTCILKVVCVRRLYIGKTSSRIWMEVFEGSVDCECFDDDEKKISGGNYLGFIVLEQS
jgi:hypothetical protein